MMISSPTLAALSLMSLTLVGCGPEAALTFHGVAERGDDAALADGARPDALGAFILYKSGPCQSDDDATCLDDTSVGSVLAEADGQPYLRHLDGDAFPTPFSKKTEAAWQNVRFSNAQHADANWSYALLVLAPYSGSNDDSNIDAARIAEMSDATPFAIGPLVIETDNVPQEELARLGLNAPAENEARSLTVVKPTNASCDASVEDSCERLSKIDADDDTLHFKVQTLGALRDQLVFPTLFGDEALLSN